MPAGQQCCFAWWFSLPAFNGCKRPEVPVAWVRSRATSASPWHGLTPHTVDSALAPRTDPSHYGLRPCTTPRPASRSTAAQPPAPRCPRALLGMRSRACSLRRLLRSVRTDTRPQPASPAPSPRSRYKEAADSAQRPQSPCAAEEQTPRALTVPVPDTSSAERA